MQFIFSIRFEISATPDFKLISVCGPNILYVLENGKKIWHNKEFQREGIDYSPPIYPKAYISADGKKITTIEGLSIKRELNPIQKAFVEYGSIQCGFCTPGMVLSAKALLDETPNPSEEEVKAALAGNLCRCTGYRKIIKGVLAVSKSR